MPEFSAWLDSWRRVIPGLRVTYACEGGKTLGKPRQDRTMNADEWLAYVNDPNPRPLGFPLERE